jgi:hypothetical protein
MTKDQEEKKVLPQRQSVHVVFFSCQNCGEEVDYIQFCPDCGKPMRVIDVVEKFGDEADDFIKKIEDRLAAEGNGKSEDTTESVIDEEPNIIVLDDEDDHIDIEEPVNEGVDSLGEIFPDDPDRATGMEGNEFSDLDDIVAELDKEDEDDFSLDELGDDGLPEL